MATNPSGLERSGSSWWVIPAAVVVCSLALQVSARPVPVIGSGWARLDPNFTPVDLNTYVKEYVDRPDSRTFNDANLGGYLIYYAPHAKIFMDDRCELYGDDWIKAYSDTLGLPPDDLGREFERWREKFQFDRAFIMTNPPEKEKSSIERYLLDHPEKWREAARGKRAAIFERVQ